VSLASSAALAADSAVVTKQESHSGGPEDGEENVYVDLDGLALNRIAFSELDEARGAGQRTPSARPMPDPFAVAAIAASTAPCAAGATGPVAAAVTSAPASAPADSTASQTLGGALSSAAPSGATSSAALSFEAMIAAALSRPSTELGLLSEMLGTLAKLKQPQTQSLGAQAPLGAVLQQLPQAAMQSMVQHAQPPQPQLVAAPVQVPGSLSLAAAAAAPAPAAQGSALVVAPGSVLSGAPPTPPRTQAAAQPLEAPAQMQSVALAPPSVLDAAVSAAPSLMPVLASPPPPLPPSSDGGAHGQG
jgi:hypothetical protein